ncbi:protein spinster homolog 1-like [Rhopilema esculentum]|uniref:protein spinster homolog 1-like n=1 Tax=Rhopilema esculentum TaxID=499914 RepID=UPI0031E0E780|eukprot:gene15301-6515_t
MIRKSHEDSCEQENLIDPSMYDSSSMLQSHPRSQHNVNGAQRVDDVLLPPKISTCQAAVSLALLVFINLLNYMDRLTIAGVLPQIKSYYGLDNTMAGLLQTVFTCSYMLFAPFFGYLGDRCPRKYVIAFGMVIWSMMTLAGSFVQSKDVTWFFVIRGLVGIGEASYSTVSPTLIADMFVGESRTKALSLFYFAIPCGSGLGYIVGAKASKLLHGWQWALRITPGFGLLCAFLVVAILKEPERGAVEIKAIKGDVKSHGPKATKYCDDLMYLLKVKSFLWATVGTTLVSFVVGGLAFWAPTFIQESQKKMGKDVSLDQVSFLVGVITFIAGLTGVLAGAEISRRLKNYYNNREALVCAYGILCGGPFLYGTLYVADKHVTLSWILVFIAEVSLCMYWVPNADLRLAVIVPNRRSTAEAMQILMQHLLGDASSPFIIGAISDSVKHVGFDDQEALLNALYITPFLAIIGGAAYLFCSLTLQQDKEKEQRDVAANEDEFVDANTHPNPSHSHVIHT